MPRIGDPLSSTHRQCAADKPCGSRFAGLRTATLDPARLAPGILAPGARHVGRSGGLRVLVFRTLGCLIALLGCLQPGRAQSELSGESQLRIDLVSVKYDKPVAALAAPSASSVLPTSVMPNSALPAVESTESTEAQRASGAQANKPLPYLELALTFCLILMTIFMARSTLKAEGAQSLSRISALFIAKNSSRANPKRSSIVQSGIQRIRQSFRSKADFSGKSGKKS